MGFSSTVIRDFKNWNNEKNKCYFTRWFDDLGKRLRHDWEDIFIKFSII